VKEGGGGEGERERERALGLPLCFHGARCVFIIRARGGGGGAVQNLAK
jgi:hypothetical protein